MEETNLTQHNAVEGTRSIDIGELLLAIKDAYSKMSNQNTHKGLMVTAGSVIIALFEENRQIREALETAHEALKPKVSLT